ncbi:MAG: HlyC/CorC family transporter [Parachlamydiales bacterium]|nr:HlyC/CorC family transporter [Parachlamydiales bacterium]
MKSWGYFLILALACVLLESFFSMFEMACVSLNKVKLHYNASKNNKKAVWLTFLLSRPSYLFGTTLIAVNTVMQIGSEAARRFYESLNLSPEIAPVTQILIVLIFGELAPLFAARRYSEHVANLAVPIVYFISKILTPIIWIIEKISKFSNRIFGKSKLDFFLSKEEIEKVLIEPSKKGQLDTDSVDNIVGNIFALKSKKAKKTMIPLNIIKLIPSTMTLSQIKADFKLKYFPYIPIYHKTAENIVAIAYPRDLLTANNESRVVNFSKPPWFISEDANILDILKQFRTNKQDIAVVLNKNGKSIGFITLDQIEDEIFGIYPIDIKKSLEDSKVVIEKTLSGDMSLEEFNSKFNATLQYKNAKTLSDLILLVLNHHPAIGETVNFDKYEFTVIEPTLLGIEKVKIKTIL